MNLLGNMSVDDFLSEYWEKKPLLIKGAVKNIQEFASPQDIMELGMDPEFESRIVYNDKELFKVKHGPLTESDFNDKKWTFAAHNLNLLDPNFYSLQKAVEFIPSWLFDDIMATYSKKDSTIGAHTDKYNVFILQGSGKRLWRLEESPDPTYKENIDLKILKNFNPNIEWVLEPGDMIYIPPSVAHEGTTTSKDSISYSIGFKSLEDQILLNEYLTDMLESYETEEFYKNPKLQKSSDTFNIDSKLIEDIYSRLQTHLMNKDTLKKWFISYLSKPKEEIETGEVYIEEEIINLLSSNQVYKDQYTRFNSFKDDDQIILSINKNLYAIEPTDYEMVTSWFKDSPIEPISIEHKLLNQDTWPLVIDLFKNGTFYFSE